MTTDFAVRLAERLTSDAAAAERLREAMQALADLGRAQAVFERDPVTNRTLKVTLAPVDDGPGPTLLLSPVYDAAGLLVLVNIVEA